jgi:hypothetical protein
MVGLRKKPDVKSEAAPDREAGGDTDASPDRGTDVIPPRSEVEGGPQTPLELAR